MKGGIFLTLFNRGGYVLNFSTDDSDVFTMQSIGFPLCEKYRLSKGKSLNAYVNEAEEPSARKLLFDLLDYYEAHYESEYDPEHSDSYSPYFQDMGLRSVYTKCREIADREKAVTVSLSASADYLKTAFSSEYMMTQIDLLMKMRTEKPTDAIGKSKDLIESCCKTILETQGIRWDKDWNVAQLAKKTSKVLEVGGNEVDSSTESGKLAKQILGGLQGIASGVAEFRNQFGTGYGKSALF